MNDNLPLGESMSLKLYDFHDAIYNYTVKTIIDPLALFLMNHIIAHQVMTSSSATHECFQGYRFYLFPQ